MRVPIPARRPALAALALPILVLAACQSADTPAPAETTPAEEATTASAPAEAATLTPRLALTYDGGVLVVDATSLEVVADLPVEGFNRLNPAGDNRHALLSTSGGFEVLDLGTWAEPHGDHAHYYTGDPHFTGEVFEAQIPGHVVVHEGRTALFDDGTGHVVVLDSDEIASPGETREYTTPTAHHGVAVELSDGTLVVSEGTEEARTGIRVLDAQDDEIAASDECPGVHGEAVASDEAVVIGCQDGVVIVSDGAIAKASSPDEYGRIGNQAGIESSPIVLGDYKTDPDADLERPTVVSLIDTRTAELTLVDLPSSYTFRSLARGEDGAALVLGTDGSLHVIDPESGELTASYPVIDVWEEPQDWQSPRPAITVLDGSAYITDPATNSVHAVDLLTGEVWRSAELSVTPNEIIGVSGGLPDEGHEHAEDEAHEHSEDEAHEHAEDETHEDEADDHDHDHDDDDHDH